MRIVHKEVFKNYTLTVFKMEDRYSVKIEDGNLEQYYKLDRMDQSFDATTFSQRLTATFWQEVERVFHQMRVVDRLLLPEEDRIEDDFPTII